MKDNGLDKVFRELAALDKKLRNKIVRKAHRAGAKVLAAEVRDEAPVDSGRTRRSVKVRAGKRKKDRISTNVEVTGGHDGPFIGFVEFGRKDQEADPFIRRSVEAKKAEVLDAIRAEIEAGVHSQ